MAIDEAFAAFDIDADHRRYVDGKLRHDSVRDFLASRGIELPIGIPQDFPALRVYRARQTERPIVRAGKLGITADVYAFVSGSTRVFKFGSQLR